MLSLPPMAPEPAPVAAIAAPPTPHYPTSTPPLMAVDPRERSRAMLISTDARATAPDSNTAAEASVPKWRCSNFALYPFEKSSAWPNEI